MNLFSFDFETHKVQPGLLTPPVVCVSAAWRWTRGAAESALHNKEQGLIAVGKALDDDSTVFVGANIAYDFGCYLAVYPEELPKVWKAYKEGRVFDVLIAGTLDAIAAGRLHDKGLFARNGSVIQKGRYSLDSVTYDYLGRSDAKKNDKWRTSYALLEKVPLRWWPDEARQYPIDDAINALLVAERQMECCKNLHNLPAQAHAAFCMHLGSIWGLRIDSARAAELKKSVDAEIAELQIMAKTHKLVRPDGTKDMAVIRERVFQAYGGVPPSTETGNTSTSRETLEESEDPVLVEFSEISKWEKLRTYANELTSLGNKPMNVACNPVLATGRASYSGLIQLMPRKGGVRECCIARPGHALVSVDYAAIEMSTLAQVQLWTVGESALADAINAGIDPHSLFAAGMTGVSYEAFIADINKGYRQAAKAGNFGFPGMMGAVKFVIAKKRERESPCEWIFKDKKCGQEKRLFPTKTKHGKELMVNLCTRCVKEAEKLKAAYLRQWPQMRPYWDWVTRHLDENGAIEQFVSKRIRGGLSAPAAANTLFQGLAADGAKAALVKMTEEMYLDRSSPLFGSRCLIFAHDETITEVPLEKLHDAGMRQAEIMISEMKKFVPDVAVKAEPAAMYRWDKDVKTVLKEGKLQVWERSA